MTEDKEEISVDDLFSKLLRIIKYLFSKWIIILSGGIIFACFNLYLAVTAKPVYNGTLTFVLSTSAGNNSSLASFAGQFGFDVGDSKANVFSGDNILELFKSRKMIQSVLFKKPPDVNNILANIIVKEWGWDKLWYKKERTKNQFPFPDDKARLSPIQDSLLREIYNVIVTKNLSVTRLKNLSVYQLGTISTNEVFSCYLTRLLMDETASFYINTKTASAKQAVQLLQKEADSLRGLLSGSIVSTASEGDRTFALNPAMQVQRSSVQQGQIRTGVIATAYGDIVRNLELAKINLQKENPLYQIIDSPSLPLVVIKKSKTKAVVLGFAIGVFIITMILLFLKVIKYIKNLNKSV